MSTRSYFPVEHVIVLMLENRSYDHMLGYLPSGHGLAGDEFNLVDPSDPTSEKVHVSNTAGYISVDPAHDFVSVEKQLYGKAGQVVDPAPMNGFVAVHIEQEKGDVELGKKIMECFDPGKIPALTTLAQEFCVCDRWFSAVPGPTWLNRFFVHAATCDGMIVDSANHKSGWKKVQTSPLRFYTPWGTRSGHPGFTIFGKRAGGFNYLRAFLPASHHQDPVQSSQRSDGQRQGSEHVREESLAKYAP